MPTRSAWRAARSTATSGPRSNARGVRIGLHPGGKRPLAEHSRHYTIGLRVDDLDEAVATLEARGVVFQPSRQDRGSRIAYFADPDGNPLYLIELKWG